MHEQRLQIVPALGSPSAAPYLRPLLSRDTPGPGDTQQVKPGLLSCRRFLYTAPARPPARFGHASFPSGASGSGEPSSSHWRAGIVPEVRPIRPRPSVPCLGPGQSPLGRGASRTQSSNLQQSPAQRDPALQQAHLAPPGDCGSTRRSGEGLSSVCSEEAAPRDRLHLVPSKDFSPPRLREIEPPTKKLNYNLWFSPCLSPSLFLFSSVTLVRKLLSQGQMLLREIFPNSFERDYQMCELSSQQRF